MAFRATFMSDTLGSWLSLKNQQLLSMKLGFYKVKLPIDGPGTLLLLEIPNVPNGRSTDHHGTFDIHWELDVPTC
jgi:hypothetical protein